MNINIKITEGCGIVVNRNELSSKQAARKNQLYSSPSPIPQRDRPPPPKPPSKQPTLPPKKKQSSPKVPDDELKKFEKELSEGVKQLNKNQATLGMFYSNAQIVKGQQEIINGHQEVLKDLMEHRKRSEDGSVEGKGRKNQVEDQRKQQEMLRQMTTGVNKELEEIRRLRDDIFRVAKQFTATVSERGKGAPTELPGNLVEMNKNLKTMVQTSKHNIDLISPEKLQLLSKLQNFNLEGYTQHLNQLKSQISIVQKQSQQVQKQLKQRLSKLQKVTISPKFQQQLLQPYQQNIKNKLNTIDLTQARKKVLEKLGGEFDYVRFEGDLQAIGSEIRGEMAEFGEVVRRYRIDVPEIRLEQKELRALDIKLPSILEEYKALRGIVIQPPKKQQPPTVPMRTAELSRTGQQKRTGSLSRIDSARKPLIQTGELQTQPQVPRACRPRSIEQLQTKPKDYSTSVQYKNISEEERFKTVLNGENAQKQRREAARRNQEEASPKQEKPKGRTREEEDFQKYLEARANEELEQIYKEKKEKLIRMKNELYQEAKDQPAVQITLDRRNKADFVPKTEQKKIPPKPPVTEQPSDALGEAGRKLIDTREGMVLKDIGKEVLLERIKDIFSVEKPPVRIEQPSRRPQAEPSGGAGVNVNNLAEGFLSVINSTLASMNRGLTAGIQKKLRERQQRQGGADPQNKRVHIPLPILQDIPKPPVFNLKFQRNIKGNIGQPIHLNQAQGYPTFTGFNQPPMLPSAPIVPKLYNHLDVSNVASDLSRLDLSKEEVASDLSGVSGISRSGNISGLVRSRPLNQS